MAKPQLKVEPVTPEAVTDSTVPKQLTPWKAGQSGNPKGRPVGSRNKVVQTLVDLWNASLDGTGAEDLEKLRQKDVATYFRLAMQFVPSKVESLLEVNSHHHIEIRNMQEFTANYRLVKQALSFIGADENIIEVIDESIDG